MPALLSETQTHKPPPLQSPFFLSCHSLTCPFLASHPRYPLSPVRLLCLVGSPGRYWKKYEATFGTTRRLQSGTPISCAGPLFAARTTLIPLQYSSEYIIQTSSSTSPLGSPINDSHSVSGPSRKLLIDISIASAYIHLPGPLWTSTPFPFRFLATRLIRSYRIPPNFDDDEHRTPRALRC